MPMKSVIEDVRCKAIEIWKQEGIMQGKVKVTAKTLSTEEAIGNPEGDDFPLQTGKERLMEAEFMGSRGQAFTDRFGDFSGSLSDIAAMPLENNFRRAIFVATLNAVMRSLGQADKTVHCKDDDPATCAARLPQFIKDEYGMVKITQIGFQPAMVQALGAEFRLRVLDMDKNNIGTVKRGTMIEGPEATADAMHWADVLAVTGTVLVNGTLDEFLHAKPVFFYGTTIAGAASIMGWKRFCAMGS